MANKGPPAEGTLEEIKWAKRSAWIAIALLMIPFLAAFSVAIPQRVGRGSDALVDIQRVQLDIEKHLDGKAGEPLDKRLNVANVVDKMVREVYGEEKSRTPDQVRNAKEYGQLVATIANEWRAAYLEYERAAPGSANNASRAWIAAYDRAADSLYWDWVFALSVQFFNVFVLPGLGVLSFLRASREIEAHNDEARKGFSSFARAVLHQRNRNLLATKRHIYFWRRYALGAILVLGTTYMFAPRGQLASALGSYMLDRPVPGGVSHPYFADHFIDAPILVTGFVGYLLYLFTASLHRSFTRNLNDRFTLSLLSRGLVVSLLGLVLSAVADGSDGARALVFIVGIFPQRGIEWLSKKASLTPEGLPGMTSKFDALPEIDEDKVTVLREMGIDGAHDLARCDLERVLGEVGIDPNLLVRAADHALLLDTFGVEGAKKLEALPAYTASELVLFVSMPAESLVAARETLLEAEQTARAANPNQPRQHKLDIRTIARRSDDERKQRMAIVAEKLGAVDVSVQVATLEDDDNVQLILHQLFAYAQR